MPKLNVYDIGGKEVDSISLKDSCFGIESNKAAVFEAILNELANKRRGSASTKTRGDVRGGGKKPWKQKGTGRARHGSTRQPQWRKGGVAHGPHPKSYSYTIPNKLKKLAYKSIISDKVKENGILILNELKVEKPKTKDIIKVLENLKIEELKILIIIEKKDDNLKKSIRNMKNTKLLCLNNINCHDLMNYGKLLFTKTAITDFEKQLEKKDGLISSN